MTQRGRYGRTATAGVMGAALVLLSFLSFGGERPGNLDDGFIVLVYARHLARGGRFYWNVEDGPVDGFTSMLDLAVKSAAIAAFPADPVAAAFFVTLSLHVACAFAGALLLWRFSVSLDPWARLVMTGLAGAITATSPGLADGSWCLLETPLYVLVALGALAVLAQPLTPSPAFAALLALLVSALPLARPEGLVPALLIALFFAVEARQTRVRARWLPAVSLLVSQVLFVTWRIWLFGHPAPNTYYAKTSASAWNELRDGIAYVLSAAGSSHGAAPLAALALGPLLAVLPVWKAPWLWRRYLLLWSVAVALLGATVLSGGGSYSGARLLALTLLLAPIGLLLAGLGLDARGRVACVAGATLMALLQTADAAERWRMATSWRKWPMREAEFQCERGIAERLTLAMPGLTLAQSDFQRFKFFSDGTRVVDLHGLNDRRFARDPMKEPIKFGKYKPENGVVANAHVWVWGFKFMSGQPMSDHSMREILDDPRLRARFSGYESGREVPQRRVREAIYEHYLPASLAVCGSHFNFLVRKDVAPRFAVAGIRVGTSNPAGAGP